MAIHNKKTVEKFIADAISVHGNKYDYSKVVYVNRDSKIEIFCKNCQSFFLQSPNIHINKKSGCAKCARLNAIKPTKQWIDEFNKKHNNKYYYPDSIINAITKIKIICPLHGEFFQKPCDHRYGYGCQKCGFQKSGKSYNNNCKIFNDDETGFYVNKSLWNRYKKGAEIRNLPFKIKPENLLEIFKNQNGLCIFTGAKLICNTSDCRKINWSIDRIDNNKGYISDNIILVTKQVNMYRNKSTVKEFIELCNMVSCNFNLTQKYKNMSPEHKAELLKNHSICYYKKKDDKEETSIESTSSDAIV